MFGIRPKTKYFSVLPLFFLSSTTNKKFLAPAGISNPARHYPNPFPKLADLNFT